MKAKITASTITTVPIKTLKPYPQNPRKGDINAIAESLTHHGQYKPVVVQRSTNHILAGNHTVQAAKKLGWTNISATYIDCDNQTAHKIVLADNRLNDLADYDTYALKQLLESLPDLEGTGFSNSDLQELDNLINEPFDTPKDPSTRPDPSQDPQIKIGAYQFSILKMAYEAWNDQITKEAQDTKSKPRDIILDRLQMPDKPKPAKTLPIETTIQETQSNIEPINAVRQHPQNARQGDIGAITESLQTFGQYRPIVANKQTKHVLVGNHTYTAAVLLGWDTISITWVDVTPEQELKILLIDNRTSDLATYNTDTLTLAVLQTINSLQGTGYTPADFEEIETGTTMKNQPIGKTTIKIGKHSIRLDTQQINQWANTINNIEEVAERLQMPLEACSFRNKAQDWTDF